MPMFIMLLTEGLSCEEHGKPSLQTPELTEEET